MWNSKYNPTRGMTKKEITEYWINRGIEKFGDSFDYSLVKNLSDKKSSCSIVCKVHGVMHTSFYNHLGSSTGCPDCGDSKGRDSKRMTFEEFLNRLDIINPDRRFKILSKEFKGRQIKKEKIYVQDEFGICKIAVNTLFRGALPSTKTAVCPELYNINKYKKLHGFGSLDFSNTKYNGALDFTEAFCRKHGSFKTKPNWLLGGRGCPTCGVERNRDSLRSNTKEFIKKANCVHGRGTYDYSMSDYKSALIKLEIGCLVDGHGTFWQKPNGHLNGEGCPKCGIHKGGYSRSDYVKLAKGRLGSVYLIKLRYENEEFYKIGITFQALDKRFCNKCILPYSYEKVHQWTGEAGATWDLEKELHAKYKSMQYFPKTRFQGYTECFNKDLPVDEVIAYLDSLTSN